MIEAYVKEHKVIVSHTCKSEQDVADELFEALDIICADLYVNEPGLTYEEKVEKALEARKRICELMTKKEYSCPEYF